MPRPFAEEERTLLRKKLRVAARRRIEEVGVRAMSVADLTRDVGISKGAFYLLYESKDALVMEILGEVENEVRSTVLDIAAVPDGDPADFMQEVVEAIFHAIGRHPVLALLADPDEGPHIWRMVPPDEMERRVADDDRWFAELAAGLREAGMLSVDVPDDTLAAIARLALTVARDPELERHPHLVDLLCRALGAELAGARR